MEQAGKNLLKMFEVNIPEKKPVLINRVDQRTGEVT